MANNIEISCNFSSVFAQFNNLKDLESAANCISHQLKDAVTQRVNELNKTVTKPDVVVEVKGAKATQKAAVTTSKAKSTKSETPRPQPKAKTEPKAADETPEIALTDTAAIKKLGLRFEKYNDRCWALYGDTKPLRKTLKEQFKGVFNSRLKGGEGWVFRTANAAECAKALGMKIKIA